MTTMVKSGRQPALALALVVSLLGAACSSGPTASAPAPTTAPAPAVAAPTTAPAAAAAKPTTAPAPAAAAAVAVSNPPTTPQMVDAINLQGQNVEVTYWHNRPQVDQDLLQSMLDDFNKSNPYGIVAHAEIEI